MMMMMMKLFWQGSPFSMWLLIFQGTLLSQDIYNIYIHRGIGPYDIMQYTATEKK